MDVPSPISHYLALLRRLNLGFALALAIAAVTRLGWLGLVEFQYDESWALTVASSIARGQALPLVGIGSSLGIPNAPFFVYLMAIPELIGRDPRIATGFIGLLGVAAVGATYALTSSLFDRVAGTTAALIYAVSPWGIIYSRKVWGQDALPIFVTLGFWALFVALRDGRRRYIAPGLLSLTLATQLHPTALFLLFPAAILVLGCLAIDRSSPKRTIEALAVGCLGAAVVEAPFLFWQSRHGWPLVDAVRHLSHDPGTYDLQALAAAANALLGNGYSSAVNVADTWWLAGTVGAVLLVGGIFVIARRFIRGPLITKVTSVALATWLIVPIALQIHHTVPVYPHYFIVLFPVPFVLMGATVSRLTKIWATSWVGALPVAAIGIVGAFSFGQYVVALDRGAVRPEFGVPVGRQLDLVASADRLAESGPVYVGTHDSLAPTLLYLSDGRWRIFDDRLGLRLPNQATPSALIITDPTSVGGALATRWLAGEKATEYWLTTGTAETVYRLAPGVTESSPDYLHLGVSFENGLTLAGYRVMVDPEGKQIRINLHWSFEGLPPSKPPTVFTHLLAEDGQWVAGHDGLAYDPTDWRPGEMTLKEFDLPWSPAPGTYLVEVGLYDYPSLRRFQITNSENSALTDSVLLKSIQIQ